MRIGILGGENKMLAYSYSIRNCGFTPVEIEKSGDLAGVDGLIIYGEDYDSIVYLLNRRGMTEYLKTSAAKEIPVFGVGMGLVLMAQEIQGGEFSGCGLLNIYIKIKPIKKVLQSEKEKLYIPVLGEEPVFASTVNAPEIIRIDPNVDILCIYKGKILMVRQGNYLGATFYPRCKDDRRVFDYFGKMVRDQFLYQQKFSY